MPKPSVYITGTGSYVPSRVMTNKDLEKLVETSDDWITTRTGIKERRIASHRQATSDLAIEASRRALRNAGRKAGDLNLIVVATITPDMFFPSTACFVQKALGASKAIAFDVGAACSGFLYALDCAKSMLEAGPYRNALVIGAEKLSAITNWHDRSTCVLFGDGAGAVLLEARSPARRQGGGGILSTYLATDAEYTDILNVPGGGSRLPATPEVVAKRLNTIHMEGREVFKLAVRNMLQATEEGLRRAKKKVSDLSLLIPHQANLRIIEAMKQRLKLPGDRVFVNLHKYGNVSAATTPIALDEARREGRIKSGDLVELVAFGSGLTWGSAVIQW